MFYSYMTRGNAYVCLRNFLPHRGPSVLTESKYEPCLLIKTLLNECLFHFSTASAANNQILTFAHARKFNCHFTQRVAWGPTPTLGLRPSALSLQTVTAVCQRRLHNSKEGLH